jgi:hypothetical protein
MPAGESNGKSRRARGPERAGALLSTRIREASQSRGFAVSRLLTHWTEIAGAEIAKIARPVEMTYGKGFGATLTLLTTGAYAPMVEMQKEKLREKVNAVYGYNAVSRIRITQTSPTGFAEPQADYEPKPVEPTPEVTAKARQAVANVGDDSLRAALETLGRHILNTKTS